MKVETIDMSGFEEPPAAKGYERVCQQALWAGIKYLSKLDKPSEFVQGIIEYKNITGIAVTPESWNELETIWSKMDKDMWHGWTGAQHQAVVGHLRFIAKNGVQKWLGEFKEDRKFEIDLEELSKK